MKLKAFMSNREAVETWLDKLVASFDSEKLGGSYWFVPQSNGFGLSILSFENLGGSGQFHLSQDGQMTMHVEAASGIVTNSSRPLSHFHELEDFMREFVEAVAEGS